jgi:hypothetical protein
MDVSTLESVFSGIPAAELLSLAEDCRARSEQDVDFLRRKEDGQYVTKADVAIQLRLLEYFAGSALGGCYVVKAEEQIDLPVFPRQPLEQCGQLIIDPLDGTDMFFRGGNEWGSMVGWADGDGRLQYSWNLFSDGSVYCSLQSGGQTLASLAERFRASDVLHVDIFDYGAGAAADVAAALSSVLESENPAGRIRPTAFPSAIAAGRALCRNELDCLIWLPSERGKRSYPDYDLIFLGALRDRGWHIALGCKQEEILAVVVAPTARDLDLLWRVAESFLPPSCAGEMERELRITGALRNV